MVDVDVLIENAPVVKSVTLTGGSSSGYTGNNHYNGSLPSGLVLGQNCWVVIDRMTPKDNGATYYDDYTYDYSVSTTGVTIEMVEGRLPFPSRIIVYYLEQ